MSTTTSYKAGTAESTVEFAGLDNSYDRKAALKSYVEKNKRLVGIGSGFIILVLFVFFISGLKGREEILKQPQGERNSRSCSLLGDKPSVSSLGNASQLFSSDDRKSLASFRGYLEFYHRNADGIKEREKYQPLHLQSIDWLEEDTTTKDASCKTDGSGYHRGCQLEETSSVTKTRRLKLTTDCAVIELAIHELSLLKGQSSWITKSATIVYDAGSDVDASERMLGYCQIKGQLDYPSHHYYQCKQSQSYDCKPSGQFRNKDQTHIRLWAEEFVFELNGDADIIKNGQFSKKVSVCTPPTTSTESK